MKTTYSPRMQESCNHELFPETIYGKQVYYFCGHQINRQEIATTEDRHREFTKCPIERPRQHMNPCQYEIQQRKTKNTLEYIIIACISSEGDVLSPVSLEFPDNQ